MINSEIQFVESHTLKQNCKDIKHIYLNNWSKEVLIEIIHFDEKGKITFESLSSSPLSVI